MIIYHCCERIGMRRLCCCTCCTGDRLINNMPNPIIKVHEGKLKGAKCKTINDVVYYSFKKIPYAKPPENELRFSVSFLFNLDLFARLDARIKMSI